MREALFSRIAPTAQVRLGEVVRSSRDVGVVGVVGRRGHVGVPCQLTPTPPTSSSDSANTLRGRRGVAPRRVTWQVSTLRQRPRRTPGPLAVSGGVAEVVAAQTTPWQPTSHCSMQVGKTVKTSIAELCGDIPDVWKLHWATARLRQGSSRSRLQPAEDLSPSIGVRDVALWWPMPRTSCGAAGCVSSVSQVLSTRSTLASP
jgi:hypothetical protein